MLHVEWNTTMQLNNVIRVIHKVPYKKGRNHDGFDHSLRKLSIKNQLARRVSRSILEIRWSFGDFFAETYNPKNFKRTLGLKIGYAHGTRLGIRGTHLKSSIQDIVDEVAPIKKAPYGVEGRFIQM